MAAQKPHYEKARAHVLIEGRVQGVFFRANTCQKAEELGLTGWVKNTRDGQVEAVFEGPKEDVEKIIEWCRKGPPGAVVTHVEVAWEEPNDEFRNFSIRYW
ncbi:MAG TPA: acylphosphatase [Candidatus Hypogeohydataceae bacterium YC41]